MKDCLFCKIAAGEIPSKMVYEDEQICAFYDIAPAAPVHVVVIPKEHIMASAFDATRENSQIIADIFVAIAKIVRTLGIEGGYRVVTNSGENAGQTVNHLHFHILCGGELGKMA